MAANDAVGAIRSVLDPKLNERGSTLLETQRSQLAEYLALLQHWNSRMNLTALEDLPRAVDRLLVEPVLAAELIDHDAASLVDVGSGGGSPAIPLKIARPTLALTMVEVKTRKSVFLREVVRTLGLVDTKVETGRFEDVLARPSFRGAFDVLSVRAVRFDSSTLALFGAVLSSGGQQLLFMSGGQTVPPLPAMLQLEKERPLVAALDSRVLVVRRST